MDHKTPEELRANYSIRDLQSLRGTLRLHWGQMNTAWQTHNPADGNADVRVLAQLDAIVEATKVAVVHVLRISGKAISIQIPWRPTTPMDPDPARYTSLSDFHCKVMKSAHKDSPHARTPPTGGTVKRADYMSIAPSNRRPTQVTRAVTQQRKTTIPQEVSTRPEATYATNSAAADVTNRGQIKSTPSHCQAAKPAFPTASNTPTIVKRKSDKHLQHGVVVKKSTHVPANIPKGAWHTDVERVMPTATTRHTNVGRTIRVQSAVAGSRDDKLAPNASMPSGNLEVIGATSRNLPTGLDINCNAKKTEADLNNRQGATCVRPDVQTLNVQLYGPHTSWACAFCPSQLKTLLELTDHIYEIHRTELFPRRCEPRQFRTEDPRLAREPQRPQPTLNEPPVIPTSRRGEKAPNADVTFSAPISAHMSSERPRDHDNCSPYRRRPCQIHNVEPSSSDDEGLDGLEQVEPPAQRIGSFNFPPLNLQYQFQGDNNNAKPANSAANPYKSRQAQSIEESNRRPRQT